MNASAQSRAPHTLHITWLSRNETTTQSSFCFFRVLVASRLRRAASHQSLHRRPTRADASATCAQRSRITACWFGKQHWGSLLLIFSGFSGSSCTEACLVSVLQSHRELWREVAERVTVAVQQIIEFAKMLPGFMELLQDDQIMLLKGGQLLTFVYYRTKLYFHDFHSCFIYCVQVVSRLRCCDLRELWTTRVMRSLLGDILFPSTSFKHWVREEFKTQI